MPTQLIITVHFVLIIYLSLLDPTIVAVAVSWSVLKLVSSLCRTCGSGTGMSMFSCVFMESVGEGSDTGVDGRPWHPSVLA